MSDVDVYDWFDSSDHPDWEADATRGPGRTVRLDGVDYLIDTAKYRHRSLPSLRDTIATSQQADDSLYTSDAAWNRYAYSWHHGAGAQTHDFGDDPDPHRFARATGVDPWTPYELKLGRKMLIDINSPTLAQIKIKDLVYAPNGSFYAVNEATNSPFAGNTGIPGNWSEIATGLSGTAQSLETFAGRVYLGTSTKIQRDNLDYTWVDFTTSPVKTWTMLRYAGGRFFGFTSDGIMYEIASDGTADEVFTPPSGTVFRFRWNTCFALGSRIFAGGSDLRSSHLWSFDADSTGRLFRGNVAVDLPPGEQLNCGAQGAGFALLGTTKGIRFVRPVGDGTLEFGPLIGIIGDQFRSFSDIAIGGRWAWARSVDPLFGDDCLIRIDLSTFTRPLAPAWSWDAALRGSAESFYQSSTYMGRRHLAIDHDHDIICTAAKVNTTYYPASVAWGGVGISSQQYPYDDQGVIESAPVFHGTVESKRAHSLHVVADQLIGTQTLVGAVVDAAGRLLNEGEVNAPDGPVRGLVVDLHGEEVDNASVTVELLGSGSGRDTPVLRNWRLRAFPSVPPAEEWIVPLMLHGAVRQGHDAGTTVGQNPAALLASLRARWVSKESIDYIDGGVHARVRIEQFEIAEPDGWAEQGGAFQMVALVRLLSV